MCKFSKLKRTLIVLIVFTSSSVWGETETRLSVNKEEATRLALQNNKELAAAKLTIERAKARHTQAGKWENPELKLGYSSDRAFNDEGESTFEIGFEQSFPVTNRLRLLKGIAGVEISLSETEILNHERLLIQEVESVVTSLTYTEKQLELRKSLIELNNKFAAFIESRIETGEASSIEVNQIKIELYSIKQEIQQLENERVGLLSSLRQLLGVEVTQKLEVNGELILPDLLEVLPRYSETMLQDHPEYQLKQFLYSIADSQVSLAMAERWGDIAVEVFFENERSVDEPGGIGTDRFFGIGVSIPLPLNNRYRGAIDENRAYRQQVEKEMDALSLSIRSQAEALKVKAEALHAQAIHYRQNVTQLVDQNLKDMNAAYSSGQISLTELFRSQEQRVKLQSNYLSMVKAFKQALVDWKAATATNQLK